VAHRNGSFVYPVIDGIGWEGGFVSTEITGPKDEKEIREERERLEREAHEAVEQGTAEEYEELALMIEALGFSMETAYFGPPQADVTEPPFLARDPANVPTRSRAYRFNKCHFYPGTELPTSPGGVGGYKRPSGNGASQQCHGSYEEHDGEHSLSWAYAVVGEFKYKWNHWVWLHKAQQCVPPWGPDKPRQLACEGPPLDQAWPTRIAVHDHAIFEPDKYMPPFYYDEYVCGDLKGVMTTTPAPSENGERVLFESVRFFIENIRERPCLWTNLREVR